MDTYERLTSYDWIENISINDNDTTKLIQYALRLQQLEDKIDADKLVELPCRIGDPVWTIMEFLKDGEDYPDYKIVRGTVKAFHLEDKFYIVVRHGVERPNYYSLDRCIFNEEEANKKLKELNDKKEFCQKLREGLKNE